MTPAERVVRRFLAAGKVLTPTEKETFSGGRVWKADHARDRYVHFTSKERAEQILAAGKLLHRPPYKKFGIDAVNAVSAVWGWYVPSVQTTHLPKMGVPLADAVAIVFTSPTKPDYGVPEEVVWHTDVILTSPKVVPLAKGAALLKRTPEQIGEDDQVTYP